MISVIVKLSVVIFIFNPIVIMSLFTL